MSVTNTKSTRTASKASKKTTQKAQADAVNIALRDIPVTMIAVGSLVHSALNVRKQAPDAAKLAELAESIKAVGVLQNLVVYEQNDSMLAVAAGGRRLSALQQLLAAGDIDNDFLVPVKVVSEDMAVTLSLTENSLREDMHPADQIRAFMSLSESGKTAAQIGSVLGYTTRHVQKCLRLAGMAPALLEALATDAINLDQLQALSANEDHQRQLNVWQNALAGYSYEQRPEVLRREVLCDEISAENNIQLNFVGRETYEQAGGDFRYDLFTDEGFITDPALLERLTREKLHAAAKEIAAAEGWKWSEGRLSMVRNYGEDAQNYRLEPQPDADLTAEEHTQIAAWEAERNALEDTEENIERVLQLNENIEKLTEQAENRAWLYVDRIRGGVVASLKDGALCIQRGVMLRVEDENAVQSTEKTTPAPETTHKKTDEEEPRDPVEAISLPLLTKMSSERTLAVQAALMQQPEKSVALLAWTLCLNVFGSGAYNKPAQVSLTCKHYSLTNDAPSGKEGTAFQALMQEGRRLETLLPQDWKQDFTTFFTLNTTDLTGLLSFCTACSLDGVQTREMGHTSRSPLDALEVSLGFHMRDWWQPTKANFFDHLKKPQIIDALNEAGQTGAARDADKMKKGDAAELAEIKMANNRWVPVWMCASDAQNSPAAPEMTPSDAQNSVSDASDDVSTNPIAHAA
ncbi:ParB N-terminal domain-containing protein [Salmonella enterica]|nr:chromosome partitioning protein ParB [Salmonella enterica]EHG9773940.1 ParB N-terminal domain-containing protein [Salmonella enterica]EJQ3364555.1 ParB N-terminal domain-containing protein [Salmonella enterica]ELY2927001.1 ParB N-terminal domain-containing protein [Salmonella enterica]